MTALMVCRAVVTAAVLLSLAACGSGQAPPSSGGTAYARVAELPFDARLDQREANVAAFYNLDAKAEPAVPPTDMMWRLRNAVGTLESYLGLARRALANDELPQTLRERLGDRVQRTSRALDQYRHSVNVSERRLERQAALVSELNREFGCEIRRYDEGQQVNFARELSLAEKCDPLVVTEYKRAAELFLALGEVSLPVDSEVMTAKARYYLAVGQLVSDLDQLKRQLLELKVVSFDGGVPRIDLIGHPFQSVNNANWLDAYLQSTRKLNRELEKLGEPTSFSGCPEPACDPAIHRLAEAVALKPPLDFAFLRDGDQVMPPAPYGFSYFVQRYDANGEVRAALGLDSSGEWRWRSEEFVNMLDPENLTLTFTHVFAHDKITLSVANWEKRTEFPPPLPILYLVQEARRVVETLKAQPKDSVAARVRDIQFTKASSDGIQVSLNEIPGGVRLNLAVLEPPGEQPIESVREHLHEKISEVIRRAAK